MRQKCVFRCVTVYLEEMRENEALYYQTMYRLLLCALQYCITSVLTILTTFNALCVGCQGQDEITETTAAADQGDTDATVAPNIAGKNFPVYVLPPICCLFSFIVISLFYYSADFYSLTIVHQELWQCSLCAITVK